MNMARARRRWRKWDRYADQINKITGGYAIASRGMVKSYDEEVAHRALRVQRAIDKMGW